MSSTDDRIVRMQFENKQFMKGAADSQKALADVNKAVDGAGKSKGLLDLSGQMNTVGVTASKMAIVTTTALATITNKVVNTGLNMAKALTFDPIKQGFTEYESLLTKQNVIMNATGKSAKVVKGYLNDLNHYSDQTIYSFGDMTDSITKFVNAGVPLPRAVTSIKGIANAAAYSGATTQEASRAMYAFSQSMQTGYIMLQDWMQVENANMGTQEFKNTLLEAGVAAGTLTRQGKGYLTLTGKYVSSTKGWRDGLQEQWATTEVLNDALGKYADKQTELGRKAFKSAQDVRTFTAFMDTLKESIGSGWSMIFTSLIGNLKQATSFWTGFSNAVGGAVKNFFTFISTALKTWRQMGGFEKTLQGFKNILSPFAALLKAIGDAWHAAFPSSDKGAGKALYGLSAGFEAVTRPLTWLAKGIPAITPVLTLLFTAIHNGGVLIGSVIHYITDFVTQAKALGDMKAPSAGGFAGFVQDIVKYVNAAVDAIEELIKKGSSLGGVFSGLSGISMPGLPDMSGVSAGSSDATAAAEGQVSKMSSALSTLKSLAVKIGAAFSAMWDEAKNFFSGFSAEDVVTAFNQAIFATMGFEVIRFINSLNKAFKSFANIGGGVAEVLGGAGSALESFQTQAKAKLILNIGIALGILAVSLWILSKIPFKGMVLGLAGLGGIMFGMTRTIKSLADTMEKIDGKGTNLKLIALSVALAALGASMLMIAVAQRILGKTNWGGVFKGLITMRVLLMSFNQIGKLAENSYKSMLGAAAAIAVISGAMIVLAGALLLFQFVKWESMGKAGAALAGLTLAVGALAMIPYEGIAKVGLALLSASAGMLAIANALILFALVQWESIGKAVVMLGALALAVGAILIVSGGGAGAAVILATASALVALALACIMFNAVDWESIGKAAVVLTLLVVAVAAMAAVLTVFLYAIAPVAPVLIILAAGFALLGVGLLAFSAAMAIAMGLAAAGTAAFAALATGAAVAIGVFLQTLALQAPVMRKSILKILQEIINTIVQSVPMIIKGIKDLWHAIMKELGSGDKKKSFGQVAGEWIDKLIGVARTYIPKLVRLGIDLVLSFLKALASRAGEFATIGIQFLTSLIRGIGSRAQQLANTATDVVIKLAQGLEKNAFKMANAGIQLIAKFLHDLASAIRGGSSAIGGGITDVLDAMRDVGVNMVKGLIGGVGDMFDDAMGSISGLAEGMVGKAKSILKIFSPSRVFRDIGKFLVMGLSKGIQDNAVSAITSVASMITGAIAIADEYVSKYMQKLDQQAIAARARAQGLAAAADKATKSAKRTKDKGDDKAATRLRNQAKKADKLADKEEREAKQARKAEERKQRWQNADAAQRAEIRADQAQSQLAAAKAAERDAEAARIQANALREQAKKAGSPEERKKLLKEARELRKQAREDAERANKLINNARNNAADALVWQKKAGEEAAQAFQEQFDAEAKADADAAAFEKLTDAEKAEKRRQQAAELQAKADKHLAKAKELAYTDLEAANELAQQALAEAEQARQFLDEATQYSGGSTNEVIDLQQTDAAALAYNDYAALYDAAYAAAAGGTTVEFNQYNSSPESLSDAEIYRQTNNQLTFASEKLAGVAAA